MEVNQFLPVLILLIVDVLTESFNGTQTKLGNSGTRNGNSGIRKLKFQVFIDMSLIEDMFPQFTFYILKIENIGSQNSTEDIKNK